MAAITATAIEEIFSHWPCGGQLFLSCVHVSGTGMSINAADEWIPKEFLKLRNIHVAWATTLDSGGGNTAKISLTRNARGTGQAEDSSYGDLGIETNVNFIEKYAVFALGR